MKSFVVSKVLIVNEKGEVLALRRSQDSPRRPGEWDFAGGWTDENEEHRAAVIRETQEETGLIINIPKLIFAMSEPTGQNESTTWLLFVAHITGNPEITLSDEHDAFAWKKPEELLKEIKYDRQQKMLRYVLENKLLG